MSHLFRKNTILPSVCLALVGVAFATPYLGLWSGSIGLIADTILLLLAAHTLKDRHIVSSQWIGVCVLLLAYIILASSIYFLFALTPLVVFLLDIPLWMLAILSPISGTKFSISTLQSQIPNFQRLLSNRHSLDWLALPIVTGQLALFAKLFEKATDIALGSPWLLTGNNFFFLFGVVTLLLLGYQYLSTNNKLSIVLLVIHYFLLLNVITIIYKLGFGYDPFLHRAAEQFIVDNGAILPKTPFYLGQYVSVVGLAFLTHLPIKLLDIFFVPAVASLTLPLFSYISFTKGFGLRKNTARVLALLIPLYPLQYFFVTTPHNFAVLLTFIAVLLFPVVRKQRNLLSLKNESLLFIGVALSAVATHPLSGMFALWLVVGTIVWQRKNAIATGLYLLMGAILVPFMLGLYYVLVLGLTLPPISQLITAFSTFLTLFQRPYYFIDRNPDLLIQTIYMWQWSIPAVIIGLALLYLLKHKEHRLLGILPLLVVANMYIIATWITSSQLSSFEQIQYAERLRHITLLFILPLALTQLGIWFEKMAFKKVALVLFFVTPLLTASWYLTYPQRNESVHFPGYNVTKADVEAARIVAATPDTIRYIVLSNILTAAASIEQFGFTHYFETEKGLLFHYPVPTGSPLYDSFSNMLYQGQKREYIDDVFALTNADRVYFMVHHYWTGAPQIIEGAKKTADRWQEIENGAIVLFEYNR